MVDRLRAKPGGTTRSRSPSSDIATTNEDPRARARSPSSTSSTTRCTNQASGGPGRCLNAAAHLAPGGCFVIEVGIPDLRRLSPGAIHGAPYNVSPTTWSFDEYDSRQHAAPRGREVADLRSTSSPSPPATPSGRRCWRSVGASALTRAIARLMSTTRSSSAERGRGRPARTAAPGRAADRAVEQLADLLVRLDPGRRGARRSAASGGPSPSRPPRSRPRGQPLALVGQVVEGAVLHRLADLALDRASRASPRAMRPARIARSGSRR